jgi:hypothetical protein
MTEYLKLKNVSEITGGVSNEYFCNYEAHV